MKITPFVLVIILFLSSLSTMFSQNSYETWLQKKCELAEVNWDFQYYDFAARGQWERFGIDRNYAYKKSDELGKKKAQLVAELDALNFNINTYYYNLNYNYPKFHSKAECEKYKKTLWQKRDEFLKEQADNNYCGNIANPIYNYAERSKLCPGLRAYYNAIMYGKKAENCDCEKLVSKGTSTQPENDNLETEFLTEIAKINADIAVINRLAREKQIVESFGNAKILCDKLRRYQGQQYFSTTLKKIRKQNPGFSFTITPLEEQVTRKYWIRMRNRANIAYRNALDAYKGCVYNEGIQQFDQIEIPLVFAKATYDLITNVQSMFSKQLFGTLQDIYKGYKTPSESLRPLMIISEDIGKAGTDAYDWKSYVGVLGGFISAYDGYINSFHMVKEHVNQSGLLVMNRQSADNLIKSSRKLLQEFDKYRAFIDAHSSSIDCLNDRIMRIDLDNKSIAGDKITIWGTGLFSWDGDEYLTLIKEAGEDLKNEYIYCEDFIKIVQIATSQANSSYNTIEEKVNNSGADKTQITAQLSQNRENSDWFKKESVRLTKYYAQFCEVESNTFPDDVEIVSTSIIPGVETQPINPDEPPVWEDNSGNREPDHDEESDSHTSDSNNQSGENSSNGNVNSSSYSGGGWSAQKVANNPETLEKDISKEINRGKTPTGIYVDNKETYLQYINENPLGMTSWNMEWYNNAEELQSGISVNLEKGYFPMGISFTDSGKLYVLYIMSKLSATAWQLVESETELKSIAHDIQPLINNQYIPVGITIYSGMYYTLMVQLPDSKLTNWSIEGYEENSQLINQQINSKVSSGLIPFGYLKKNGVINVLYIRF